MASISVEELWTTVLPNLNSMFQSGNHNIKKIFNIYTQVHRYCSQLHYDDLHPNDAKVGIRGWPIYSKLQDFFQAFCKSLSVKSDNLVGADLLIFNNTEWNKFVCNYRNLNRAFLYLNNNYVARARVYDPQIYKIGLLAINTWKESFFKECNHKMVEAAVSLINLERQGEIIDSSLIADFVKYSSELAIYAIGENDLYTDYFEKLFLEGTDSFYNMENTFLLTDSVTEYVEKVKKIFREEQKRVSDYLHSSTEVPLVEILQRLLIHRHLERFYAEFKQILALDRQDDLRLLYLLMSIHVHDLSEFVNILEKHIADDGLAYIERLGEVVKADPKMYTDVIVMVYKKYSHLISYAFSDDDKFKIALHKAAKIIVNRNVVTMAPNTVRKTSELVTKYCDQLLRKGNTTEHENVEEILNDVFIIFTFIEDKDVLQDYYMKLIAKRLVNKTSNSEDLESNMIIKMKAFADFGYITKLQKMLQDIKLSKDLTKQFDETDPKLLGVDFDVMVLSRGSWPFETSPIINLPLELQKCVGQFDTFYFAKHSGKRLIWLYHLSNGEVCTTNFKSRYTIQASTSQISIMLLFNSSTSWTLTQIQEETKIDIHLITKIIQILLKTKLVTSEEAETLTPNSTICLNTEYNNKKHRLNINIPLKSETKKEQEDVDRAIDEERRFIVQAVIVRIMKSRKTLKKIELIAEILESLAVKFKPNIDIIKKCIKLLIVKNYIECSSTDPNTYNYVA